MSVEQALREARTAAAEITTGDWLVRRKTGETRDGFTLIPTWVVVHRGPARLRAVSQISNTNDQVAGQATVVVQDSQLSFLADAPIFAVGDVATCLASMESGLVGRHWRIEQPTGQREQASALRHRVREVSGTDMPAIVQEVP